jgi:hypothetical protein
MIYNADWRQAFTTDVLPRLSVAHRDLTTIAAALRNTTVDIWTESPSDRDRVTAGRTHYSLEGWRAHFKAEFARLSAFRTAFGTVLQAYDGQAKTALDGYVDSLPRIATAFTAVTATYTDAQGRVLQTTVAQADRTTLAAAIEAELQ